MPHWSETKWLELGERRRIVKLAEKRGRRGETVPNWWLPIVRDYYEMMKTEALKSGDKRAYRAYSTKQTVFSLLAQRTKKNLGYEKNPAFDRFRKKHERIGALEDRDE
jgi:hypothetical protein